MKKASRASSSRTRSGTRALLDRLTGRLIGENANFTR